MGSCTEGEGYEGDEVTILKQQMKEVLYRISIMETELRSIKNTKQTQEDEEPHYNGQHSGPPIACTDNGDEEEPVFGDHPLLIVVVLLFMQLNARSTKVAAEMSTLNKAQMESKVENLPMDL